MPKTAEAKTAEHSTPTFADLDFRPHRGMPDDVQAKTFFPNGYGVSVIRTPFSYGGDAGLYELGVLVGDETSHSLTYDTPVTNDVEGYLTPEAVTELLAQVAALPMRASGPAQ